MTIQMYRKITGVLYDGAIGTGTDNSTDTGIRIDPNNYLVIPVNSIARDLISILIILLIAFLIIKNISALKNLSW